MTIGEPDKSEGELLILWQTGEQDIFVMAIGLAQLALSTVAVDGMMKLFLRNADEQLYRWSRMSSFRMSSFRMSNGLQQINGT